MKDKNNTSDLKAILDSAQATKEELRSASKNQKDESLKKASESIDSSRETLKAANEKDMEAASTLNLQDSFIDFSGRNFNGLADFANDPGKNFCCLDFFVIG